MKLFLAVLFSVLGLSSAAFAQTCVQADLSHPLTASLNWVDTSTDETGFVLERKLNTGAYSVLAASVSANMVSFTDSTVVRSSVPNTYTYRLKAIKSGAPDSAYSGEACITFAPIPPAPTLALSATPNSVVSGSAAVLTWSSTNATACTASSGWSGAKAVSGSQSTGNLTANTTYILTCTGAGGSIMQSVSVTVTVPTAPNAPSGLTVAAISGVTLRISWEDRSMDENRFEVWGKKAAGNEQFIKVGQTAANFTTMDWTGLRRYTTYCAEVRAGNAGGDSSFTSPLCATTSK